MAQLTPEQLKQLLDKGLTLSQVKEIAAKRGDTVPGPTLLGSIAQPIYTAGLRFGQAAGSLIAGALGAPQENIQKAANEARVQKLPFLGTYATESQKPIDTKRGREQVSGLALESAGTLFPVGRGSAVFGKALGKTLGTAASLGTSGYAVESGFKLQEGDENALTPGLGTLIPAAIPVAGKVLSGVSPTFRFAIAKATGLNQETVQLALTRPEELTAAQTSGLNRLSLGNLLDTRVKDLTREVSEEGAKYKPIRESGQTVKFKSDVIEPVLKKYGLTLEGGSIRTSPESPPLTQGDISSLERFIAQFGGQKEFSANAFLNARQGAGLISKFEQGLSKTQTSKNIARDIYKELNTQGRTQIKGLEAIDKEFAPVRKELNDIRKEYLKREGDSWVLKDSALSKIANATGLGKDKTLARLENYVPGITQQIQLVKALEDLARASDGKNVGAYLPSILLGGGALAAASNPITAALAVIVALPQVAIPLLIAFGKANGIAKGVIRAIAGKLIAGKVLSEQELLIYKNAVIKHLSEISPGDQFFNSSLGKRTTSYVTDLVKKPALGLSTKDVTADIHPEDLQVMQDFIDSARIGKEIPEKTFQEAEKLAEYFGISMDKGLSGVSKEFEKILQGTGGKDTVVKMSKVPVQRGFSKLDTVIAGGTTLGAATALANSNRVTVDNSNRPANPKIIELKGYETPEMYESGQVFRVPDRDVSFTADELNTLRNVLYGEISNRNQDKRALEARTIINTVLNRMSAKGSSMEDVLSAKNQYQAYGGKQYEIAKSGEGEKTKLEVIDQVIKELTSGNFSDNTNNAKYYIHNKDGSITYDDLRKY